MAGHLARRSGIAICLITELIEWIPDSVYQVGVGQNHAETEVFLESWPQVHLVGCEPHPTIVQQLVADYPGEVIPTAMGDTEGVIQLYSKRSHKDGSSVHFMPEADNCELIDVPITTLDLLFPTGPEWKPCLLWLDCEGNELAVLHGGERFVEQVDVINVELTHKPPGPGWCSAVDVHDWILSHGFKRQWVHTQRSHAGQVDAIYVRPHLFRPEYCCCPCMVEREGRCLR